MNCEQVEILLNDFVDDTLASLQTESVSQHCATCESCTLSLSALRQQIMVLRSLPLPQVSSGFEKHVIKHAIEAAGKARRENSWFNSGMYKMAAAAVVAGLVLGLSLINITKVGAPEDYRVSVSDQVHTIKVAIDSDQALDGVKLRVELSNNLELSGFGNKKQINWTAKLRKGVNIISLPIIGLALGEGNITTRIRLNGKEKVMRIQTQYKLPNDSLYDVSGIRQS